MIGSVKENSVAIIVVITIIIVVVIKKAPQLSV